MNEGGREKLRAILHECGIHAERVEYARRECSRWSLDTFGRMPNR